jgi:hypothetical protein
VYTNGVFARHWNGDAWEGEVRLGSDASQPSVVSTAEGSALAVWSEAGGGERAGSLRFAEGLDGAWTPSGSVPDEPRGPYQEEVRTWILMKTWAGEPLLVVLYGFCDGNCPVKTTSALVRTYLFSNGSWARWSPGCVGPYWAHNARGVALPDGGIWVTNAPRYEGGQNFRISTSSCGVEEDPTSPIPGSGGYVMASDSTGRIHLSMLKSNGRFPGVVAYQLVGNVWAGPQWLSAPDVTASDIALARMSDGSVSAAWLEAGPSSTSLQLKTSIYVGNEWLEPAIAATPTIQGFEQRCSAALALAGGVFEFRDFRRSGLYEERSDLTPVLRYGCTSAGSLEDTSFLVAFRSGQSPSDSVFATVGGVWVPDSPSGVTGTPGSNQVTLLWRAPISDGGSPITGYTATATPSGQTCSTIGALSCTITGLTNGTSYTFTVTANNSAGLSRPSEPSAQVTPVGRPGPVTNLKAAPAKGSLRVAWSPPNNMGGATTVTYQYKVGKQAWMSTSATSVTVRGKKGVSISVSVRAGNQAGSGPAVSVSGSPR